MTSYFLLWVNNPGYELNKIISDHWGGHRESLLCACDCIFWLRATLSLVLLGSGSTFGLSINTVLTSFNLTCLRKEVLDYLYLYLFPSLQNYMTKGNKDYVNVTALKTCMYNVLFRLFTSFCWPCWLSMTTRYYVTKRIYHNSLAK